MNIKKTIIALLIICTATAAHAQKIVNTETKVISGPAAKGILLKMEDKEDEIALTYQVKRSKKGLDLETYTFDRKTLKFIEMTPQSKVPIANYYQPTQSKGKAEKGNRVLRVYPNLLGIPVMKLGYIQITSHPRYNIEKFITTSESKPKGAEGDRLVYVHSRTRKASKNMEKVGTNLQRTNIGDVQLITLENDKSKKHFTQYYSMVVDAKDLSIKHKKKFETKYSYQVIATDNLPNGDIAVLFRSNTMKDIYSEKHNKKAMEKLAFADTYHFKYMQFDTEGNIIQDVEIPIEGPESTYFLKADMTFSEDCKSVAIAATLRPFKIKGSQDTRMNLPRPQYQPEKTIAEHKAENFAYAVIKDNKLVFSKTVPVIDFISKPAVVDGGQAPSELKKYFGSFYGNVIVPIAYNKSGDNHLVTYKIGKNNIQIMQFNSTGEIKTNYFINLPKKQVFAANPELTIKQGNKVQLISYARPDTKADAEPSKIEEAIKQRSAMLYSIDLNSQSMPAPIDLASGGFIDLYKPFLDLNETEKISLACGRKKEIILTHIDFQ